ncbi:hypothetical protein [Cohnella sp. GCM10027633]|uniref:glycoside hydrolase family 78 protein n=1 Tax=unclassified Cohnella TaxID=2636738 RepID=UPI003624CA64
MTWTSTAITGQTTISSYSFNSYPYVIGVGSHNVSMKIKTSNCGESGWIGPKSLEVSGPTDNSPPTGKIGFVYSYANKTPVYKVVEGTVMDLILIHDPDVPTPFDPDDGDSVYFEGFDFSTSSSWAQSIPATTTEYGDGYHNITMSQRGFHLVNAVIRDDWGASTVLTTWIEVVPPNPEPVAGCPAIVTSNHPVDMSKFTSAASSSPRGYAIDHMRDEWTNKLEAYVNESTENITVTAYLHVYDSQGLKSLEPDDCTITVKPDLPPIAKLTVPAFGIRSDAVDILNRSSSPDGDLITGAEYKYKYDDENNGFADDAFVTIPGTLGKVSFTPTRVGQYLFYVKATENYGKSDNTSDEPESTLVLDVTNLAPEVSFNIVGENNQPDLQLPTSITANTILSSWDLFDLNTKQKSASKELNWSNKNGVLVGGSGKQSERQYFHHYSETFWNNDFNEKDAEPLPDYGYGANGLSPWRAGASYSYEINAPVLDDRNLPVFNQEPILRSNLSHFYYNAGNKLLAMNKSKIKQPTLVTGMFQQDYRYEESPFDFVIDFGNRDNSRFLGYELADRTLYVFYTNKTYSGDSSSWKYNMRTYDALTGQLIGDAEQQGWNGTKSMLGGSEYDYGSEQVQAVQKGGDVVVFSWDGIYQFDRTGKVVKQGTIPKRGSECTLNPAAVYVANGDFYGIERCKTTPQLSDYETHSAIVKISGSTLQLVWRQLLTGVDTTPNACYTGFTQKIDHYNALIVNTVKNELYARSYTNTGYFQCGMYIDKINLTTGVKTDISNTGYEYTSIGIKYGINWEGNPFSIGQYEGKSNIVTIDRYRTDLNVRDSYNNPLNAVYDPAGVQRGNFPGGGSYAFASGTQYAEYGMYIGDGFYVTIGPVTAWGYASPALVMWMTKATPTTDPIAKRFRLGQFSSNGEYGDADIYFTMKMNKTDYDNESAGYSFNMQNADNRYAVEATGTSVSLVKYVGGVRTVLGSGAYPFQNEVGVKFIVRTFGGRIQVFIQGVPFFDVTDGTFSKGRMGPYSDKAFVEFGGIGYKPYAGNTTVWSDQYAIWDSGEAKADIQYNDIAFADPENDPVSGAYAWSIQHTPRFMANQGISALNGQSFHSAQLAFDKVGDYVVELQAKDDPNPSYRYPSMTFDSYRKASNKFTKRITVHRRPIAQFTLAQSSDYKVIWTDSSYDPDRYVNATTYSAEVTGIDYKTTRGIVEKKFYFVSPSGNYAAGKLSNPEERGTYEVGMAVKDEYGAWSEYAVVMLNVTTLPPPNTPPTPGFTQSHSSTYRGIGITIDSTATDAEDGDRTQLPHAYYISNTTTGGAETLQSAARASWVKTFSTLGVFLIRQVVEDSQGAMAQFERQITINNRIPSANVTVPSSADQSNPTKLAVLRPAFAWTYGDADNDVQTQYQANVYRYGGTLIMDSGVRSGSALTWTPSANLPEHTNLYVQARVFDGYDWSNWSSPKYFYIETNRPPTGDFGWTPSPVYEGDSVQFRSAVGDPDGDSLAVNYEITPPSGAKLTYAYTIVSPYASNTGPLIRMEAPGNWKVTMTVSDGKAPAVVVTKTVRVDPLQIIGTVKHTEAWEANRLAYNAAHEPDRPPGLFWAGEAFVLEAATTDTGPSSATKAASVVVRMFEDNAKTLLANDASNSSWGGLLRSSDTDIDFTKLADGNYTFLFTATYSNGTVKTDTVTIAIRDSTASYVQVHRIH